MTYARSKTRKFLSDYFNDNELTNLCFDYFPLVENNFTLGMGKDQKIRELLVYCENRGKTVGLLAALERERPELYADELREAEQLPAPIPSPKKPERNANQIFLSYSSEDADLANGVGEALRQNGWEIWMAPDSIFPGEKWAEAINRGLEESGTFLLLMTESVLNSRWVKTETASAIDMEHRREIRFIPLAHDDVEVPPLWRNYQWIPFSALNEDTLEHLLAVLEGRPIPQKRKEEPRKNDGPVPPDEPEQEPTSVWQKLQQSFFGFPIWRWIVIIVGLVVLYPLLLYFDFGGTTPETTPSAKVDSDGDGLSDAFELEKNLDPNNPDSDGDGLEDNDELENYATEPWNPDTDGDGLLDGAEANEHNTDPGNPDTDGDGLTDKEEIEGRTDPRATEIPTVSLDNLVCDGVKAVANDADGDGMSAAQEAADKTDPNNPDTDGDGVCDGYEKHIVGTDPLDPNE